MMAADKVEGKSKGDVVKIVVRNFGLTPEKDQPEFLEKWQDDIESHYILHNNSRLDFSNSNFLKTPAI